MEQDRDREAASFERVIVKNEEFLRLAAEFLHEKGLSAGPSEDALPEVVKEVLKLYRDMRARLLEIETLQHLLSRRQNRPIQRDPEREGQINELNIRIKTLSARLEQQEPLPGKDASPAGETAAGHPASEQWLGSGAGSAVFAITARLLDELDYENAAEYQSRRLVQGSGRGFTLFSVCGPPSTLDAIHPGIELREHDIIERFSATEIRGVLTHLRQMNAQDVMQVFQRFLAGRFSDVKCMLVGVQSPDQLDAHFLEFHQRMIDEMQFGEIRAIDISTSKL